MSLNIIVKLSSPNIPLFIGSCEPRTSRVSLAGVNVHVAYDKIKIALSLSLSLSPLFLFFSLVPAIATVARGINVGVTHAAIDLVANPFCLDDRETSERIGRVFFKRGACWKFDGAEVDGARKGGAGVRGILL